MTVHIDCSFFRGDIPCLPHKKNGYHCADCPEYKPISEQILIIKLGAIGDVIRTTPLLNRIRKEHPNAYITWLTYSPDILSSKWVNRILPVTAENIELVKNISFDWLINLDKDPIAISLLKQVNARKKNGFTIDKYGHAASLANEAEYHKWLTGLFDDVNKENKKHYVQEIFEICDLKFNNEDYILEVDETIKWDIDSDKHVVGLNTGCGGRWTSRLWPTNYWIELAQLLLNKGYEVIILGGEQEHQKNLEISKKSGAKYFGYFPLKSFMSLMNNCQTIVSAVTMAMHIAIALKKNLILFNNIFNKNEFYLYGRGEILEPDFDCDCYFTPVCPNDCMQYLSVEKVLQTIYKTTQPVEI